MDHIFINIKEPSDALQLSKKTTVRSHVARRQWKNHSAAAKDRKDRKRKHEEYLPIRIELDCSILHDRGLPSSQSGGKDESENSKRAVMQSTGVQTMLSTPNLPPMIGGLRVDPFWSYPIPFRPFLPHLVDHYLISMAVDIPELDQPGNRGLLRTRWFPLVMTEPSLFLVIMLIAASHHATMQQHQHQHHNQDQDAQGQKLNLLTLRCEAVHAINQALTIHREATPHNNALIGAIAKMASYEAMFGSRDAYTVHMQGLQRVVGLRGGLDCLEEVMGGLLRRIVVWIDRNSAFLNGCGLYFPGEGFRGAHGQWGFVEVEPNPGHFLGAS